MRSFLNRFCLGSVFAVNFLGTAHLAAVTVTLSDGDPCAVMGALIDHDGDGSAALAVEFSGRPSKPNIGTRFLGASFYPQPRRAIAEYALEPVRDVTTDVNAVNSATLRFYFDDVIFPDFSPAPWTTQDFTLEVYTDSADGHLGWSDANDGDAGVGGGSSDDWQGEVLQTWRFQAGDVNGILPGHPIVGHFGPHEPFPARFGDDELAVFGMIGFEVDVTSLLRKLVLDSSTSHIGFRWISNALGGFWTSLDPKGHLPTLSVDVTTDTPLSFRLQSTDRGPVEGEHGGRPYHIASDPDDEAIYLTVWDWEDGHFPGEPVVWPLVDGVVSWDVMKGFNESSEGPAATTTDGSGVTKYVFWDPAAESYALVPDPNQTSGGLVQVFYRTQLTNRGLSIGNNGIPAGANAERQHVLLTEFNLQRPGRFGLDPNHLVSARIELTIDRVVDMALSANNGLLLPSQLFVNAYPGDGILNDFENAQGDFARINRATADTMAWLTMDGKPDGIPITDFELSLYRILGPGAGEPLTLSIDVTEPVRRLLQEGAPFAGFTLSCSPDGEYAVASVDLIDVVNGKSYLPALILETNLQ